MGNERYVTSKAIEIISTRLRSAVENISEGREMMALGQYIAGMGFLNVGLALLNGTPTRYGLRYS